MMRRARWSPASPLSGTGVAPVVQMSPSPIDFGAAPVGGMSPGKAVKISNGGSDDLHINVLHFGGTNSGDFSSPDAPNLPLTIAANAATMFHIVFSPTNPGPESAEVDIGSDDPQTPTLVLSLAGLGAQMGFSASPPSIDFGNVMTGVTTTPKPLIISNTGDSDFTVSSIALSGTDAGAFAVDNPGPIIIGHGKATQVGVTFSPTLVGAATAVLTVRVGQLTPETVMLRGSAFAASLGVSPAALDFGVVQSGRASAPQTVTIENAGSEPLTIDTVVSSDPVFAVDTTMTSFTLGPGGTTTFAVVFTPAAVITSVAQVGGTTKGKDKPIASVRLSGAGSAPAGGGCTLGARPAHSPLLVLLFGFALVGANWIRRRMRCPILL